jgi:hypothetical protein
MHRISVIKLRWGILLLQEWVNLGWSVIVLRYVGMGLVHSIGNSTGEVCLSFRNYCIDKT